MGVRILKAFLCLLCISFFILLKMYLRVVFFFSFHFIILKKSSNLCYIYNFDCMVIDLRF
jgi:hypothetical protein